MSPRPRLTAAEQDRILDDALAAIAERGIDSTRLLDVARAGNRSTGTLQHYFGSREELLAAALARLNDRAASRIGRRSEGLEDPWARIVALVGYLFEGATVSGEWPVWIDYWSAGARDERLRVETVRVHDLWRRLLGTAIRDGLRSGRFAVGTSTGEAVRTILVAIDGMALHVATGLGGLTPEMAARGVLRIAGRELGLDGYGGEGPRRGGSVTAPDRRAVLE